MRENISERGVILLVEERAPRSMRIEEAVWLPGSVAKQSLSSPRMQVRVPHGLDSRRGSIHPLPSPFETVHPVGKRF